MVKAAGGFVPLYGVAISDALKHPNTSLDELNKLREQGHSQLRAQGDLPGALRKLEAEIARRAKK
ncbi:MAG: hypothetical protein JWO81_458 [Alphaproteobacteria bacterium]|nr:hypothetical protein [Alphaproteobacteria bacterium]